VDYFRQDAGAAERRIENELRAVHGRLEALEAQKRRVIDVYASGDLSREGYVEKNRQLDGLREALDAKRRELEDHAALLRKSGEIDAGISQWCEAARVHFARCRERDDFRQFLLHYVTKVVQVKYKVSLHGFVPIRQGFGADARGAQARFLHRERGIAGRAVARTNANGSGNEVPAINRDLAGAEHRDKRESGMMAIATILVTGSLLCLSR
jgi:hypothetical protein